MKRQNFKTVSPVIFIPYWNKVLMEFYYNIGCLTVNEINLSDIPKNVKGNPDKLHYKKKNMYCILKYL